MRRAILLALALAVSAGGAQAAPPRSAAIKDPDTRAWWEIAEALSSDAMQGRDTGSPGYDRAAAIVVQRFRAAGLKPAGDDGGWFQVFKVHEVAVEKAGTSIGTLPRGSDVGLPLKFLQEVTVRPTDALPNGRYVEIADAGHLGFLERPNAVNSAILNFFAESHNSHSVT